jgi:hypothetical protein
MESEDGVIHLQLAVPLSAPVKEALRDLVHVYNRVEGARAHLSIHPGYVKIWATPDPKKDPNRAPAPGWPGRVGRTSEEG